MAIRPEGLILVGENESEEKKQDIANKVAFQRSHGANWSYAIEPAVDHFGNLAASDSLTRIFFSKILPKRLSKTSNKLKTIPEQSGWLGNNNTNNIFPFESYPDQRDAASWLINEEFARAWKEYQEK